MSPFTSGDIAVRLTAIFGHDPKDGSFVRSLFFIDANDLHFTRDAADQYKAHVELTLLAVGDNGEILAQWRRAMPVQLTADQYRLARERGILHNARMLVKSAGAYQIRVAVLDTASGKVGSGSQFLEVPRVGSGKLALSGVLLKGLSARDETADDSSQIAIAPAGLADETLLEPTVRILEAGTRAVYAYEIYDGLKADEPSLTVSTTLVRNGRAVYQSPATPARSDGKVRVIPIAGSLDLGNDVPSGPYLLEVTVARARKGKVDRHASQWVDFEVR
jgi:hypothetical protein